MRALIVDDERLARARLKTLLAAHPSIEVVAEAASVALARQALEEHAPDLLFLDIAMPGETGFDLVAGARLDAAIVFVTAHDEHAIRAFEVGAVDYLLKPIVPERLAATIERLQARVAAAPDRLYLKRGAQLDIVEVSEIAVVRASGDLCEINLQRGTRVSASEPLHHWEERLGADFLRVHRSALVALAAVERLEPSQGSTYQLVLRGVDEPVPVSRSRLARVRAALDSQ